MPARVRRLGAHLAAPSHFGNSAKMARRRRHATGSRLLREREDRSVWRRGLRYFGGTEQTLESTYPDAFKVMFSLGLRHQVTQHVALGGSTTYVQYLPVSTGHQGQGALAGASKVPNEDGDYRSRILFFNLTRGSRFDDWEN